VTLEQQLREIIRQAVLEALAARPALPAAGTKQAAEEAEALILRALERHDARRPLPKLVTTQQAAEMLGVSVTTIHRMRLPRVGKLIPYDAVARQLSAVRRGSGT
jgi:hypothetical protein